MSRWSDPDPHRPHELTWGLGGGDVGDEPPSAACSNISRNNFTQVSIQGMLLWEPLESSVLPVFLVISSNMPSFLCRPFVLRTTPDFDHRPLSLSNCFSKPRRVQIARRSKISVVPSGHLEGRFAKGALTPQHKPLLIAIHQTECQ